MARLSSLITAAVSVCSDMGEGNLKYIMEPFGGVEGGKQQTWTQNVA